MRYTLKIIQLISTLQDKTEMNILRRTTAVVMIPLQLLYMIGPWVTLSSLKKQHLVSITSLIAESWSYPLSTLVLQNIVSTKVKQKLPHI